MVSATVAAAKISSSPSLGSIKTDPSGKCAAAFCFTTSDVLNIIHTNQSNGSLPPYGPNTLIIVFPSDGFGLAGRKDGTGYHGSESLVAFWAVVPQGPMLSLMSAYEIFDAATNPAIDQTPGWDDVAGGCPASVIFNMPTPPYSLLPGPADNTLGGVCSTTGYSSVIEAKDQIGVLDKRR